MSPEVVAAAAQRIAEHARAHALPSVEVILHGGEPLLAGLDRLTSLVRSVRAACAPDVAVSFSVQTNGLLLTESFLRTFLELGIRVGVSLDGGEVANDRHRLTLAGRGSYASVAQALKRLGREEFGPIYGGILCTIDLANDPVETYEALALFRPPRIDMLLPTGPGRSRPRGSARTPTG